MLDSRNQRLAAVAEPLPGSIPYTNRRLMRVRQRHANMNPLAFVRSVHSHLSASQWQDVIERGDLLLDDRPVSAQQRLTPGQRLVHVMRDSVEPWVCGALTVVFEDPAMLIVNKPAPLPTHPCGRFNRNTALYLLRQAFPDLQLRPVHRLDANTTGLLILAKTRAVAADLGRQMEALRVSKSYLARAAGTPPADAFDCALPIGREPIAKGARCVDERGREAFTEFRVQERLADGTVLLLARPHTGRTNQIRIHLRALGLVVVGDDVYDDTQPPSDEAFTSRAPLCLHAWQMSFTHPQTGAVLNVEAPPPARLRD